MKSKFLSIIRVSGALLIASSLHSQVVFNFNSTTNGGVNYAGLEFWGDVTFNGTAVNLNIWNSSSVPSLMTGIYLLKPYQPGTTNLINVDETSGTYSFPNSDWEITNTTNHPGGDPATILSGSVSVTSSDYFGAFIDPNESNGVLSPGGSGAFSFTLNSGVPNDLLSPANFNYWNDYVTRDPGVLVRYRQVGDDNEDSGAGWAYFELSEETPVIPEPSEIAFLAMLGLGGLVFARRRLQAKRK